MDTTNSFTQGRLEGEGCQAQPASGPVVRVLASAIRSIIPKQLKLALGFSLKPSGSYVEH